MDVLAFQPSGSPRFEFAMAGLANMACGTVFCINGSRTKVSDSDAAERWRCG